MPRPPFEMGASTSEDSSAATVIQKAQNAFGLSALGIANAVLGGTPSLSASSSTSQLPRLPLIYMYLAAPRAALRRRI